MRLPNRISWLVLLYCAALCLAAAAPVCAQGQSPQELFGLQTCGRGIQVFDDGTVIESRDGKQTRRRLSASRMRKLRRVIARAPCPMQFETESPRSTGPTPEQPVAVLNLPSGDCYIPMIVSGTTPEALQRVEISRRYGGYAGSSTVYVACEGPTAGQREWLERSSQEYIKPKWQRLLSEVVAVIGGENILKGCKCRPGLFTR